MSIREIEELLGKYYEGDTTVDEERRLREFFTRQEIPGHLLSHAPLFRWQTQEQRTVMNNPGFQDKLNQKLQDSDGSARTASMTISRGRKLAPLMMAAGFLLLIGLLFSIRFLVHDQVTPTDTLSAELAYAQTTEALSVLSANFNVGLTGLEKLNQFDKATNQLESFGKFFIVQSMFINPDEMAVSSQN